MRELEFLPQWYERRRRHRRWVAVQGWAAVVVALGLTLWMVAVRRNIRTANASLASLRGQLGQSRSQLTEMDRLGRVRRQWQAQEELMARLGFQVEAARLIRTLDGAMPKEVSLVSLQVDTEQREARRQLRVTLQGVAPTDGEVASLVTQLGAVSFFEQVAVGYSRESSEGGRVLRAFEISFSMNLNAPMGP